MNHDDPSKPKLSMTGITFTLRLKELDLSRIFSFLRLNGPKFTNIDFQIDYHNNNNNKQWIINTNCITNFNTRLQDNTNIEIDAILSLEAYGNNNGEITTSIQFQASSTNITINNVLNSIIDISSWTDHLLNIPIIGT